jgi:hypothetical protein
MRRLVERLQVRFTLTVFVLLVGGIAALAPVSHGG